MNQANSYRVVQPTIHLGDSGQTLTRGEVVIFDGATLKRADGATIPMNSPGTLQGAIKIGWLVPASSEQTTFRPQPAGIQVRAAVSTGEDRELVDLRRTTAEERDVGNREDIREPKESRNISRGKSNSDEKVVGRIKTSAKAAPVEIGKDDERLKNQLDNKSRVEVEKFPRTVATGDVKTAISSDDLSDLLPEAAKAAPPKVATTTEGVVFSSGSSSVGSAEEGRLVGRVSSATPAPLPAAPVTALTDDMIGKLAEALAPKVAELILARLQSVSLTAPNGDFAPAKVVSEPEASDVTEASEAPQEKPEATGFEGYLASHWKTRQRMVKEDYAEDVGVLLALQEIEPSAAVLKVIAERIEALS